jgi:hypothetical protein
MRRLQWVSKAALMAVLFVASCTVRAPALVRVATNCDEAAAVYANADPAYCDFVEICPVSLGACCRQELTCEDGAISARPVSCEPGCVECRFDAECPATEICDGSKCVSCPVATDGSGCRTCGATLEPQTRNGCPTCECLPMSECGVDLECPAVETCLAGSACVANCLDPRDCCANACGGELCPFPVPLGCLAACPVDLVCDGACVTTSCTCDGSSWRCDYACAPLDYPLLCRF